MENLKAIKTAILDNHYKNPLNSPLWLYSVDANEEGKARFLFYCFLEELSSLEKVDLFVIFKGRKKSKEIPLTVFKKVTDIDSAYVVCSVSEMSEEDISKIQTVEMRSAKFSHMVHIYTPSDYQHFEQYRQHGWDYLVDNRTNESEVIEKPKKRVWLWVLGVLIVVALTILFLVNVLFANDIYYYKAVNSLNEGDYTHAIVSFTELNDFKDSKDLLKQAQYGQANEFMNDKEFQKAYQLYVLLADYQDSATLKNKALYQYSVKLMDEGNYEQALDGFSNIADYEDVNDRVLSIRYLQANALYEKGSYSEAATAYKLLLSATVNDSNTLFTATQQKSARKNYFLSLDKILEKTATLPYEDFMTGLKEVYNGLSEFSADEDVAPILISQRYWQIALVGEWRTSNNLFQFNVTVSDQGAFSISHNLEGYAGSLEMKVQDSAIYIKQEGASDYTKWLTITFANPSSLSIFNEINQSTIEMTK